MDLVAPAVGGWGLITVVVALLMFLPLAALKPRRSLAKKLMIGGGIAFVAGLALTPGDKSNAPSRSAPAPQTASSPTTVVADHGGKPAQQSAAIPPAKVIDSGYYPPILNLDLDFGESRSGAVITAAGEELVRLASQLDADYGMFSRAVDTINFTVLGKAGSHPAVGRKILHFSIEARALRELSHRHASGTLMLNAAKEAGSYAPTNNDVIDAYCVANTPFCAKLRT